MKKHNTCPYCGITFPVRSYGQNETKFCSLKCYGDSMRGKVKDEGGKSYKLIRRGKTKVLKHRILIEQLLGTTLARGRIVHHINGDKRDNRIENLMVMTQSEHSIHHNAKHPYIKNCVVCGCRFVPRPTKRKTAKTCSASCLSMLRKGYEEEKRTAKQCSGK